MSIGIQVASIGWLKLASASCSIAVHELYSAFLSYKLVLISC